MIITSYFKTGIRNFVANKVSSMINIIGLATTIGIGLVVYLIIDQQLNLDKFHPDHQKIFTVQSVINREFVTNCIYHLILCLSAGIDQISCLRIEIN